MKSFPESGRKMVGTGWMRLWLKGNALVSRAALMLGLMVFGLVGCSGGASDSQQAEAQTAQASTPAESQSQEQVPSPDEDGETASAEVSDVKPERPMMNPDVSPAERAFHALDSDNNAYVSAAEAAMNVTISHDFTEMDLDSDGRISLSEFVVYAGEVPATDTSRL